MSDERKSQFRFNFRVLAILLLISAVPLLLGTWWLFQSYEQAYLESVGVHLSDAAENAYQSINAFIQNQIIVIAGLTESPALREAVRRGNQDLGGDLEAVRRAIPAMESQWAGLAENAPQLRGILGSPAADFLKRYQKLNPSYREIMVTDFLGRLVAATGKTTDYYQADEDWWKQTYGDGRKGTVFIGDIVFDESTKSYSMELAQPFVRSEGGVEGIIKVVLDVQAIHSIIASLAAGPSASAVLLRAKGEVISAPGYGVMDQSIYPATLEILNARERGRRYFVTSGSPESMYGLPRSSFQELYPNLNWIVVTTGSVGDLVGALPNVRRYFIWLVAAVFFFTLFATLLVSRMETRPVIHEDPHLEKL